MKNLFDATVANQVKTRLGKLEPQSERRWGKMTAAAVAASNLLKSLLFGIAPHDPVTFAAVPLFFAAVALAAGIVPARRAARLNPMEALRTE
jgi:ABC-type lipoprotein release transport system permease subunit